MKRFQNLTRFALAALFVAALAAAACAQNITVAGRILLKQADGTTKPLPGAVVKFYRTDIKQEFETRSDKNGRYVHAGLPFIGTYTITVSGPGARPTYFPSLKLSSFPADKLSNYEVVLEPGDGAALTPDQIKAAEAAGGRGTAGGSAPSAEDKKKAAELEAERAKIDESNKKASELNAKLPDVLKAGNDAYQAKDYVTAVSKYDEGIALDPTQSVFYLNKTAALSARGADRYNAGVKARPKDQAAIDGAKTDLKTATESAEKAIETYRAHKGANAGAGAAAPQQGGSDDLHYLKIRSDAYRVALQMNAPVDNDAAAKAIEEYIGAEPDQALKDKAQASLADALRFAGRYDESIAKFREVLAKNPNNLDAIYGLGIALASKSAAGDANPALVKEAHDALQQYVSKAPDGTRKDEAAGMVKYLEDTLKGLQDAKDAESKQKAAPRRRP
jgi:tetratricopeptide (TPR) repeat protein